jgi:serine/threonine protein kinase
MSDSSTDLSPDFSLDSFVQTTRKSGLIDPARLQSALDQLPQEVSGDARLIAQQFVAENLLTDWQASKLLRGKHKGFSLGKYRLLRLLGKGGMSSVYLAEHTLMRRRCAIKVLPIGRVDDTSWLARFHREAQAIAALDHPNIVRAYDVDHEQDGERDIHFLVMEFVDGRSIQEIVADGGPLSLELAADYFRQAALGLEHAHRAGLVHRDVKPGNLLVDQQGVVKVLDLGLARFAEVAEEQPLTVTHDERVLGTADYLSPEQAIDSHTVDARADVYSLGCSIYFALTGRPPFKEGSLAQRLMAHQMKDAPPIAEFRPEIGDTEKGRRLVEIIRRMMAREPGQRFQTMAEVAAVLDDWRLASQQPASAVPTAVPVAAPPIAVPVARPVAQPPVAQPVGTAPVAQPVNQPGGSASARVAQSIAPAQSLPVAPAAAATPGKADLPPATAAPLAAPPVTPGEVPAELSVAPIATPVADDDAVFDPSLIPQTEDGAGDFPSILGGVSDARTSPPSPADVADFTATESFLPEQPRADDGAPDFSAFDGTPAFPEQPSPEMPTAEAARDEFLELLPDDDGPDELDRTILTPGTGSSFADIVPPSSSSEPAFPQVASPPIIPEPLPAFSSAPQAAAEPVLPAAEPAFPAVNPVFHSFDAPAPGIGGFAATATPSVGEPSFGQAPAGQFGTAPPQAVPSPVAAGRNTDRRQRGVPPMLIAGVLAVLILGGGAGWFLISGDNSQSSDRNAAASSGKSSSKASKSTGGSSDKSARSTKTASSGVLKTILSVGPGREFKTITAALAYVKANKQRYPDTTRKAVVSIEVAGSETFSESVEIDNSNQAYPSGIIIKSTNEFPFTLKPPGTGPALRVVSVEHLQIDNVRIDAAGKDVAVELEGFLDRSRISNAVITGFRTTGILGKGLAGVARDEVVFDQIDLRPANPGAVGIKLTSGKASTGRIQISDCRLFGPQAAGLLLDNGALGLEVRRTIIDQADLGISFAGGPMEWRDVRVVNCTFYQNKQAAIHFSDMPVNGTSGLEFRRNLFAALKGPEMKIASGYNDQAFDPFLSTQLGSVDFNWSDRSQAANPENGERELIADSEGRERRVSTIEFFSTDRDADDFLTLQRGNALSHVALRPGDDADPFIGARPQAEPR